MVQHEASMKHVPRGGVRDIADRIIAATPIYFIGPTITHEATLRNSEVEAVW